MSLTGLDAAKVKEAHQAAIAESSGWYVDLLRQDAGASVANNRD